MAIKWVVQCSNHATEGRPEDNDWLPPAEFSTLDMMCNYMHFMQHTLVPDPSKAQNVSVHFRVKSVPGDV